MKKLFFTLFIFLVLLIPNHKVFAINEVNIYLFYSDSCDICSQEKIYLDALKQKYPNIRIYFYDVDKKENNELMKKAKAMYNQNINGIPYTVIGDKGYLGFSQVKKPIFQKQVYEYSKTAYKNELGKILNISYKNDLDVKIEEYKGNSDYKIEETSGKKHNQKDPTNTYDKYKISIYLVAVGLVLALVIGIINLLEKKDTI